MAHNGELLQSGSRIPRLLPAKSLKNGSRRSRRSLCPFPRTLDVIVNHPLDIELTEKAANWVRHVGDDVDLPAKGALTMEGIERSARRRLKHGYHTPEAIEARRKAGEETWEQAKARLR